MDADTLRDWAGVFAFLISLGTMVYAFLTSKSRANEEKITNLQERAERHSSRIDKIETDISHMPAKDDVTDLKLNLAELKGVVGRLDEGMSGMSKTVTRVEEFLINKGK